MNISEGNGSKTLDPATRHFASGRALGCSTQPASAACCRLTPSAMIVTWNAAGMAKSAAGSISGASDAKRVPTKTIIKGSASCRSTCQATRARPQVWQAILEPGGSHMAARLACAGAQPHKTGCGMDPERFKSQTRTPECRQETQRRGARGGGAPPHSGASFMVPISSAVAASVGASLLSASRVARLAQLAKLPICARAAAEF